MAELQPVPPIGVIVVTISLADTVQGSSEAVLDKRRALTVADSFSLSFIGRFPPSVNESMGK